MTVWLHVNAKEMPDVRSRQAIAFAIDRGRLIAEVFQGFGDQTGNTLVWSKIVPIRRSPELGYDFRRAESLAKESALAGKVVRMLADARFAEMAAWLAAELAKLNIRPALTLVDGPPTAAAYVKEKGTALWPNAASFGPFYGSVLQSLFLPSGSLNWNAYSDPDLDQKLAAALGSDMLDVRNRHYEELQRVAIDAAIVIPLVRPRRVFVTSSSVRGIQLGLLGLLDLTHVTVR